MSNSFTAYAVEFEKVQAAAGSKDTNLLRAIGARLEEDMASTDAWFEDQIAQGAPTQFEALGGIIEGSALKEAYGYQYAYAYELLCRYFGHTLDVDWCTPFPAGLFDDVEDQLSALGVVSIEFMELAFGRALLALPYPDDFPGMGRMKPSQIARLSEQLAAADCEGLDADLLETVEGLKSWTREAQSRGCGIVTFYY